MMCRRGSCSYSLTCTLGKLLSLVSAAFTQAFQLPRRVWWEETDLRGTRPGQVAASLTSSGIFFQPWNLLLGINSETIVKPASVSEEELLTLIMKLNNDDSVDGLLVQLPLPGECCSGLGVRTLVQRQAGSSPRGCRSGRWFGLADEPSFCGDEGVSRRMREVGVSSADDPAMSVRPLLEFLLQSTSTRERSAMLFLQTRTLMAST